MEGKLPLIPKSSLPDNHDAEHIITEVFQEILQKPKFPENVARNLCKFNVELPQLKQTACEVKTESFRNVLNIEDIAIVEQRLMRKHGKHLMRENYFAKRRCGSERRLLKRRPLFTNIKVEEIRKFGLIQEGDLFPNKLQRNMDFRINQNFHNCKPCVADLDTIPVKLEKQPTSSKPKLRSKRSEEPPEQVFKTSTDAVTFDNYQLNTTYKKRFKVQNVGKKPNSFHIEQMPRTDCFKIELLDGFIGKISPGMCAHIEVTFKTDVFRDVKDHLLLKADALIIPVEISSQRHAPNLCIFIHKGAIINNDIQENFSMDRSIVLNECIDCGPCFRGDTNEIFLLIKNCGSAGKFFLLNEQNWYNWEALVDVNLDLLSGPFTVTPAYFQIEQGEIILMRITFASCEIGLNLDTFMVLCDNCTCESIDVVADCLMFDEHIVQMESNDFLPIGDLINILYPIKTNTLKSFGNVTSPQSALWIWEEVLRQTELRLTKEISNASSMLTSTESSIKSLNVVELFPKSDSEMILKYLEEIHNKDVPENIEEPKYFEKFILDYALCLVNHVTSKTIYIYNNGPIDLHYYWIINGDSLSSVKYAQLLRLPNDNIEIETNDPELLPPYSKTAFTLHLKPSLLETGFYDLQLTFYIKKIPKEALHSPSKFVTCRASDKFVDVQLAEINLVCKIESLKIEWPGEIIITKLMNLYDEEYVEIICTICHELTESVNCSWEVSDSKIIQHDLVNFTTVTNCPFVISFFIVNRGYEDISETITLVVNSLYKKDLKIKANVQRPRLKLIQDNLDFGKLELGYVYSKKFVIENTNQVSVEWNIWETFMKNGQFTESNNTMFFNDLGNNIEVEYVVNATEIGDFCSSLKLFTKFKDEVALNGICTVSYTVDELMVYLHTQMSECAILCPKELLYANYTSVYTLCLHNVSQIDANFLFGEIYGDKSDLVSAKVLPNTGFIPAKTSFRVTLELRPLEVCILESLYLPCEIIAYNALMKTKYNPKDPLVLTILCVVEDVFVQLTIPGVEKPCYWPPQTIYDLEYGIEPEKTAYESKSTMDEIREENKGFPNDHFSQVTVIDDITEYLQKLIYEPGEESPGPAKVEATSTSSFSEMSSESLRNYFDEDFLVHENCLEFYGVPLRVPTKKTIAIQNMTPIQGFLDVDVNNFKPKSVPTTDIHNLLVDLNVKEDNNWEMMLGSHGIIIKLDVGKRDLNPYEATVLDVWVYANTWGIYADEIQFQINNIVPLFITVLIEIVGLPLEFPIAQNHHPNQRAIFRFGAVSYKSKSAKRKIYVRNTSNVPISVVWHIFMKTLDCQNKPITLLFDIYHPNMARKLDYADSTGNLILTHRKLCGNSNYEIFNISPKESFIDVGKTIVIDIIFHTESYALSFDSTEIEANLIGYIHTADRYRKREYAFLRKTGSQMHPLRLKLQATLEMTKLNLDLMDNSDLTFNAYACILVEKAHMSESRVVIYKNLNNTSLTVTFSIDKPFKILEIKTSQETFTESFGPITVNPNSCIEIKICYILYLDQMQHIGNVVYNLSMNKNYHIYQVNFINSSYTFSGDLEIQQIDGVKQQMPAELNIYFPRIEVTPFLDFGIVYIGNCRKLILTLKNFTTCRVPFKIQTTGELILTQTSGILEPSLKQEPFIYDISVIFVACTYKVYDEIIVVKTNVDFCQAVSIVKAIATHNEKQFKLNTC